MLNFGGVAEVVGSSLQRLAYLWSFTAVAGTTLQDPERRGPHDIMVYRNCRTSWTYDTYVKHCEIQKCREVANIWVVEKFEFHFLLHELINF